MYINWDTKHFVIIFSIFSNTPILNVLIFQEVVLEYAAVWKFSGWSICCWIYKRSNPTSLTLHSWPLNPALFVIYLSLPPVRFDCFTSYFNVEYYRSNSTSLNNTTGLYTCIFIFSGKICAYNSRFSLCTFQHKDSRWKTGNFWSSVLNCSLVWYLLFVQTWGLECGLWWPYWCSVFSS